MGGLGYFFVVLVIFFLCINASIKCDTDSSSNDEKPMYMQIFSTHQHWEGSYIYNSSSYYCYLYAHSEHNLRKGVVLATFRDKQGATIELEGEPVRQSDLELKFTVHAMFNNVNRFPLNFTMQGTLSNDRPGGLWTYKASVLVPNSGIFGLVLFQQSDASFGPAFDDEAKNWKYAVIIGIPVILAVIGVTGTVAIIYWAIKKGYIRHVPKSYDSFHNPVQFNNEGGQVHM